MFRFTIRDVLWLTVVVAVVLTLWLGWSRGIATLMAESAVREAKLQNDLAAERDKAKERVRELAAEYRKAMVKSKIQEAVLENFGARVIMEEDGPTVVHTPKRSD